MGIVFFNEQNFYVKNGVVQKKKNDIRMKWIIQRNERIIVFLKKAKEQTKTNDLKSFKRIFKKLLFLLNEIILKKIW